MLQRGLAIGGVSVCLSVRLSVTRWYWLKTNEQRIMRFSPSCSRRVNTAKNADFRAINRYISETIEDRHIVAMEVAYGLDYDDIEWPSTTVSQHLTAFFRSLLRRSGWRSTLLAVENSPGSVGFSDVQIVHKFAVWVTPNQHFNLDRPSRSFGCFL